MLRRSRAIDLTQRLGRLCRGAHTSGQGCRSDLSRGDNESTQTGQSRRRLFLLLRTCFRRSIFRLWPVSALPAGKNRSLLKTVRCPIEGSNKFFEAAIGSSRALLVPDSPTVVECILNEFLPAPVMCLYHTRGERRRSPREPPAGSEISTGSPRRCRWAALHG
jgi:hypothetical protein